MTSDAMPNGHHAAGEFTTTTRSAETTDTVENIALARTIIDKVFQGQLDQMMVEQLSKASATQFADPMYDLFSLQRR